MLCNVNECITIKNITIKIDSENHKLVTFSNNHKNRAVNNYIQFKNQLYFHITYIIKCKPWCYFVNMIITYGVPFADHVTVPVPGVSQFVLLVAVPDTAAQQLNMGCSCNLENYIATSVLSGANLSIPITHRCTCPFDQKLRNKWAWGCPPPLL